MEKFDVIYTFEHWIMPHMFFERELQFVVEVLRDKNVIFRNIDNIFKKVKIENPYVEEQFDVIPIRLNEEVIMLKIVYPKPEEELLCYCSYLFFDMEFEKTSYFCIEKGNSAGDGYPFLCSWSKEWCHSNYGKCSLEDDDDFLSCVDIHMYNHYGIENHS